MLFLLPYDVDGSIVALTASEMKPARPSALLSTVSSARHWDVDGDAFTS